MRVADPDALEALVLARPTVRAALELAVTALRAAGIEAAHADAEWLLADTLAIPRGRLAVQAREALEPDEAARYVLALRRRIAREPLQHIVGTQAFRELTLRVSGDALVPRPETEVLAGWALELLPRGTGSSLAIDLGTGSGCIACALAFERPDVRVIALDASPSAVALARANVETLGLGARVTVELSDLFAALTTERADLVVSNPPYLPSGLLDSLPAEVQHDPRLALDGGPDGLDLIRRLVDEAPRWLRPSGWLVLETAGQAQARQVAALMAARGFVRVEARPDLAGIVRFVAGGMS
jgi:release factor glutamine methyltransferase